MLIDVMEDTELLRGEELICRSKEAADSSSGVHVGDTVGDEATHLELAVDKRRIIGDGGTLD